MNDSVTPGAGGDGRAGAHLSAAYLTAALDCVVMVDGAGRVLEFNPAAEETFGYSRDEALGRMLPELIVPPSLRDAHGRAFRRFVETREQTVFGRRLELTGMRADGSEFPLELGLGQVQGEPLVICAALRDLTDRRRAENDLRKLVDEQAALRRVATLAAGESSSSTEILGAAAGEAAAILDVDVVGMLRFESDGTAKLVAQSATPWDPPPLGTVFTLEGENVAAWLHRTGSSARMDDWEGATGSVAAMVTVLGVRSAVASPIFVAQRLWGAMVAAATEPGPLPTDTESRMARFTELLATAISSAEGREALRVSRARIVAASDDARRRIERDLHDGAQQRLIGLGLDLQTARLRIPEELVEAHSSLERIGGDLEAVLEEIRELSRGLHPGLLSQGGLAPSVRALARRSPLPIELDVDIRERPSESIETAVYYVLSEALVNVVKHAHATEVSIELKTSEDGVRATVADDGVGGAEPSSGSGLVGLIDRIEALGGRLALDSAPGRGTRISIELPLTADPTAFAPVHQDRGPPGTSVFSPAERSEAIDGDTVLAAVQASLDAIYVVDAQGRIRFLNPAALRILGYDDERQLLGRPSHDTIHYLRPDGTPFPAVECPLLRPRLSGESVRVDHDWFVRQDGSLVAVAYSSASVVINDGRGAVLVFREI
jgi:PAS domain S-box-containing protein